MQDIEGLDVARASQFSDKASVCFSGTRKSGWGDKGMTQSFGGCSQSHRLGKPVSTPTQEKGRNTVKASPGQSLAKKHVGTNSVY